MIHLPRLLVTEMRGNGKSHGLICFSEQQLQTPKKDKAPQPQYEKVWET